MKIKPLDRVIFERNPLKEVVAQIRFPRNMEIEQALPSSLQKDLSTKFPHLEIQESNSVSFQFGGQGVGGDQLIRQKEPPIFNFKSEDGSERIALTSTFLAITSTSYVSWDEFYKIIDDAFQKLLKYYSIPIVTRFGLRYRNLINRAELGAADQKWNELINPRVIGHLTIEDFFSDDEIDESCLKASRSISQFKLENNSLILQTGFADMGNNGLGFFIDADLFNETNIKVSNIDIKKEFEVLHADSGSIFQRCISKSLHAALKPVVQSSK